MPTHVPEQLKRAIPSTGELVPALGLGTYHVFDTDLSGPTGGSLRDVLRTFVASGCRVVDTSPMYGRAEQVLGELAAELGVRARLFLATKVWTSGRAAGIRQMEASFRLFRTGVIDLMQVHNLMDWETHLQTLRDWKEQGHIRYTGITHYSTSSFSTMERVITEARPDFIQVYYSIATRDAEHRLLPLARDLGVGVIANRPFETSSLFSTVKGKKLPSWSTDIGCTSWPQFFLKYVLSHPAITIAIPATANPGHLQDNIKAGLGPMPDEKTREKMARFVERL